MPTNDNHCHHHVPRQTHDEDDQVGQAHHYLGGAQEDQGLVVRSTQERAEIKNVMICFLNNFHTGEQMQFHEILAVWTIFVMYVIG